MFYFVFISYQQQRMELEEKNSLKGQQGMCSEKICMYVFSFVNVTFSGIDVRQPLLEHSKDLPMA